MDKLSVKPVHVGVYQPEGMPQSFKVYAKNVMKSSPDDRVRFSVFSSRQDIPLNADILWDIRSGGGNPPPEFLLDKSLPPLVLTIHGYAPMSLPGWEYFRSFRDRVLARFYAWKKRKRWIKVRPFIRKVIAVSEFTKSETQRLAGIEADRIAVCHHGVDSGLFAHDPWRRKEIPYFLHVSNNEPRKNVDRIVAAFIELGRHHSVELVLKLPAEASVKYADIVGIRVIAEHLGEKELANLYGSALGFVFPSLYEGFGLPILEAMSSGCPVITSSVSACPEVAGEAALLVNPRRTDELIRAMTVLVESPSERDRLVSAGLDRVRQFTWEHSAALHAQAFLEACGGQG